MSNRKRNDTFKVSVDTVLDLFWQAALNGGIHSQYTVNRQDPTHAESVSGYLVTHLHAMHREPAVHHVKVTRIWGTEIVITYLPPRSRKRRMPRERVNVYHDGSVTWRGPRDVSQRDVDLLLSYLLDGAWFTTERAAREAWEPREEFDDDFALHNVL